MYDEIRISSYKRGGGCRGWEALADRSRAAGSRAARNGMTYGHNWSYRTPKPCCHLPQCPYRIERTYQGPLKSPDYGSLLPYVEPGYNCKIPPGAEITGAILIR